MFQVSITQQELEQTRDLLPVLREVVSDLHSEAERGAFAYGWNGSTQDRAQFADIFDTYERMSELLALLTQWLAPQRS